MIFLLMRGDLVWRMAALFAIAILILLPLIPGSVDAGAFLPTWAFGVYVAMAINLRPRATLFEAALPIPGRQLFLARLLPLLAVVWLPAASALAVALIRWGPSSSLVPAILRFAAIATLAALLPMSVRPSQSSLSVWVTIALWAGAAAAGWAAWELLPTPAILLLFGTASAAVFLRTLRAVPPSFQVAPVRATRAAVFPPLPGVLPLAWRPVLRSVPPLAILNVCSMALLTPSGGFFYFFAMMSIQMHTQSRNRLRWLSTLAISYRSLLLITLAASVGPLVAGVVLGTCLGAGHPLHLDQFVGMGPRIAGMADLPEVNVPLEFWRRAPGGQAPLIRAPWGETARPPTLSILWMAFYNPYSGGQDHASHRFIEWQWERATQALHGRPIPLSQYQQARKAGLPVVTNDIRFRILCLSSLLVYCLYLAFVGEFSRWRRLRRPAASASRIPLTGLLGLPAVAMLATDMLWGYRYGTSVALPLVRAALLHAVRILPDSVPLVAVIAAVPVLAMYWLLERQFRQSELLGPLARPEALCSTN